MSSNTYQKVKKNKKKNETALKYVLYNGGGLDVGIHLYPLKAKTACIDLFWEFNLDAIILSLAECYHSYLDESSLASKYGQTNFKLWTVKFMQVILWTFHASCQVFIKERLPRAMFLYNFSDSFRHEWMMAILCVTYKTRAGSCNDS